MKVGSLVKIAYKSILKNRLRSFLTMLGIIIGVASVIALIAIGEGAQGSIQGQIASLGTNMLMIMPSHAQSRGVSQGASSRYTISLADIEQLERESTQLLYISPMIRARDQVISDKGNWNTSIAGVDQEYLGIRDWTLESGSMFTDRDIRSRRKVAILGKTVVDELFGETSPIGARIRIRNVPFTVIGVLEAKGQSAMGSDSDDTILAPYSTVMYRLGDGETIHMIYASARSEDTIDQAEKEITAILRNSHRLREGDDDDFFIRSQTELTQIATDVTGTFTTLLAAIAGVSLVVGGIGIMNIMLVSVTER
ncbi:ABC transporter permease, partial [bacterium]|nr:ABC transporter permease [candidate division CSSED10-310 bacterium]